MRGHTGKRQWRGSLHQERRAPLGRRIGVTPEIKAEARGADKIPNGVTWVFRVGKLEGARHAGLKAEGVVVHVQRCEGNVDGTLLHSPPGGRLDGI